MISRRHCLLTNEFTLWDLKKWSLLRPVASRMETKLHVSRLSLLFWNTVCLWQGCKINFLLVLFTVFELYSYLLKRLRLFETKPWFTRQPCLFMYNEYIFIILWREISKVKMSRVIAQRSAASTRFSELPMVTWKVLTIWGSIIDVNAIRWTAKSCLSVIQQFSFWRHCSVFFNRFLDLPCKV